MDVSKYVLPCVTLNVVLRGRGPNITRGKRQKMFLVLIRGFVHNISSPGLEAPPRDRNPCVVDCLCESALYLGPQTSYSTPETPHFFFSLCILA